MHLLWTINVCVLVELTGENVSDIEWNECKKSFSWGKVYDLCTKIEHFFDFFFVFHWNSFCAHPTKAKQSVNICASHKRQTENSFSFEWIDENVFNVQFLLFLFIVAFDSLSLVTLFSSIVHNNSLLQRMRIQYNSSGMRVVWSYCVPANT